MERFLNKKQVRALTTLAPATVDRLEKAKRFPARLNPTPNRVAWREREVLEWMQARIDERDDHRPPE